MRDKTNKQTCQKPFTIPEGFPALLKGFTREVLRNQPENIFEFGAQYFAALLEQRAEDAQQQASAAGLENASLANLAAVASSIDVTALSPSELQDLCLSKSKPGPTGRERQPEAHAQPTLSSLAGMHVVAPRARFMHLK